MIFTIGTSSNTLRADVGRLLKNFTWSREMARGGEGPLCTIQGPSGFLGGGTAIHHTKLAILG
jgi:hypothetical protein